MSSKDFMSPTPAAAASDNNGATCPPKKYTTSTNAATSSTPSTKKEEVNKYPTSNIAGGRGNIIPPTVRPSGDFEHKPENIVVNSKSEDFADVKLNLQFQPNILDSFDVVTYHFKLFITDPETSSSGRVFDTTKQIIIAETGITDLTIDKVEISSTTTPSIEGGTGVATNVKFEIIEPSGAAMVDRLFYQSAALGIGNWATMPVYLQLDFRGRDPLTSSPDDGAPETLSSLKWLWMLKISTIKANVTNVGTRYDFEGILYNEFAQSNATSTLQHNVVLKNVDTFYDAMSKLENKLNADQLLKLLENYSVPDSFKIIVDPALAGYKITPDNKNINSRKSDNYTKFENKDITCFSGSTIDVLINNILAQTSECQTKLLGSLTPGAEGQAFNEEQSQMKKFWRIITETRPLTFDPRRLDVAREYTIFIVEYDIGILDSNAFQTSAPPVTLATQKKRLMTYAKKSILKKKYNYIFTGTNDQILNFDITINNAYASAVARQGGIFTNPFMSTIGLVAADEKEELARLTNLISRAIYFQNDASTNNTAAADSAMFDAKLAIENSAIDEDTKKKYTILLEKSKPESRLSYLREVQRSGGINNDGSLNSARSKATILSKPVEEKITKQQLNFISDVNYKSKEAQEAYSNLLKDSRGKIRPIAKAESMQDRQVGLGIESNNNSGLQKLSSMFSVALHSGLDSSLQQIKMTIKGDPFWLSPQPYKDINDRVFNSLKSETEAIDWIKNAHTKFAFSANIYGTDNFILVRFRTPRIYQGSSLENNLDENTDVEILSGIYRVNFVTSRFENGRFSQELQCNIDPELSILDINEQIQEDAMKKDVATPVSALTETFKLPETSVKKDRIAGDVSLPLSNVADVGKGAALTSNAPQARTIPGFPGTFYG